MLERRSIRLDSALADEIDEIAKRTYRTVPVTVRLLLRIGIEHLDEMSRWDR